MPSKVYVPCSNPKSMFYFNIKRIAITFAFIYIFIYVNIIFLLEYIHLKVAGKKSSYLEILRRQYNKLMKICSTGLIS